jgi:hypothetical protein
LRRQDVTLRPFCEEKGPGVNVLMPNLRISIQTFLDAGKAQREIARVLGVDRKTIRCIAREAKSPGVATGRALRHWGQTPR